MSVAQRIARRVSVSPLMRWARQSIKRSIPNTTAMPSVERGQTTHEAQISGCEADRQFQCVH